MSETHCTLFGPYEGPDSNGMIKVILDRGPGLAQLGVQVRMSSPCLRGVGGRPVPRVGELKPPEPPESPEPPKPPAPPPAQQVEGTSGGAKDGPPGGPDETWSLDDLRGYCRKHDIRYSNFAKEPRLLEQIKAYWKEACSTEDDSGQ